jgi:hypothetical protein
MAEPYVVGVYPTMVYGKHVPSRLQLHRRPRP